MTVYRPGDQVYGCAGGFKGLGGALAMYMLADAALLAQSLGLSPWRKQLPYRW